jgi:hypothetical protein
VRLERLLDELGMEIEFTMDGVEPSESMPAGSYDYLVTLKLEGRELETEYHMGPALEQDPDAENVLSSLLLDASCGEMSFEEYCSDFGYDTDSRRHHKTWKACKKLAPKLQEFLGEHYEECVEAEQP